MAIQPIQVQQLALKDCNHTQLGLAMSQSLGDHVVKDVGVISEPVMTRHDLRDRRSILS